MPKRVIDFDAMWGSDKLASCAEWAQAEYAWFYGLADASGCFELTNLRVIWGRVAAIRRNLSLERLEQIFHEFHDKGLLFVWEENGKRYGHWTGSDVPGRLPAPSWRVRLERLAPPVPKQQLAEFMSRFSRGRAASPSGGFLVEAPQGSLKRPVEDELNDSLELAQAQDWKWNRNTKQGKEGFTPSAHPEGKQYALPNRANVNESSRAQPNLLNLNSKSEDLHPEPNAAPASKPTSNQSARAAVAGAATAAPASYTRDKSFFVARELVVGQGPQCGPVRVKPEVLDRIRSRNGARDGSRSP
jgi:hypothetical protein